MKTPTDRLIHRDRARTDAQPLRFRAELPVVSAAAPHENAAPAAHDFLVANPRPDLVSDVHAWRTVEPV
jgi:hypothetical protein